MSSRDKARLRLKQKQERQLGKLTGRVKSIAEFFADALEAARPFNEAIQKALPWADSLVEAAGEVIPPVKFLVKLGERIGQVDDVEELGHLACTIAFERAVAHVIKSVPGPVAEKRVAREVGDQLKLLEPCDGVELGNFTYENALAHEFFKRAELHLEVALRLVGYQNEQINRITNMVQDNFVTFLKELLVRRETVQKFLPFKEFIGLGGAAERQSYKALAEHAKFQRWLFEEAPVLGRSPFALQHVYVETDCVTSPWGEINPKERRLRTGPIADQFRRTRTIEQVFGDAETRSENEDEMAYIRRINEDEVNAPTFAATKTPKVDPFSESFGVREPLLKSVMGLIGNWRVREPIVIQGVAGAGKSSFTLRLCVELQKHHLRPILIRFKDLRFDRHVSEALPQAVHLSNEQRSPDAVQPTPADLFRGGSIFQERGTGEYSKVSRYVLILDGWDEISVANEGLRHRMETLLGQIRSEYISNPTLSVRVAVVMTGRPSLDLNESGFLRETTPVLTVRPLAPEQLSAFFKKLAGAVREHPVHSLEEDGWPEFDVSRFTPILRKYETEFGSTLVTPQITQLQKSSLGALGLPLLAHLAARLVSSWEQDPELLIQDATALYRNLVNLTCKRGGKAEIDASRDETSEQHRIAGKELRELLWQTASAMTVYGQDIIPYEELSKRLQLDGSELDDHVTRTTTRYSLSSLLISFYFKGGFRHAGCEFAHKSFREYLFAEALVEGLKSYGTTAPPVLPERMMYWKDFAEEDLRHQFSHDLARLLAPQWLRAEVIFHLDHLIEWEISRSTGELKRREAGTATERMTLDNWRCVRNGLADLWDWWAEGVHLRPQAILGKRRELTYTAPQVLDLIEYSLPFETNTDRPRPARTTTMDSHLGHGLLVLNVLVHNHLAALESLDRTPLTPEVAAGRNKQLRRYQSLAGLGKTEVRFAPSGPDSEYFLNYIHRICSAGARSTGGFPRQVDLRRVDLSSANLMRVDLDRARLDGAILNRANLSGASLNGASFDRAYLNETKLDRCSLKGTRLIHALLYGANLEGANLEGARLDRAMLERANLSGARLDHASLDRASLNGANFSGASLLEARLDGARLEGAVLTRARLDRARLYGANLYGARLDQASFNETRLIAARLERADVNQARFDGAVLNRAVFRSIDLSVASGLTKKQLEQANVEKDTKLPQF